MAHPSSHLDLHLLKQHCQHPQRFLYHSPHEKKTRKGWVRSSLSPSISFPLPSLSLSLSLCLSLSLSLSRCLPLPPPHLGSLGIGCSKTASSPPTPPFLGPFLHCLEVTASPSNLHLMDQKESKRVELLLSLLSLLLSPVPYQQSFQAGFLQLDLKTHFRSQPQPRAACVFLPAQTAFPPFVSQIVV